MQLSKLIILAFIFATLVVQAQEVEIRNAQNETKIQLIPDGVDNGGEIKLYDPDGTRTFDVGGNSQVDQGSFINMYRGDGVRTIQLDAHHFEGGEFYLNNSNGQRAIHLQGHESVATGSVIEMFDATGAKRAVLDTDVGLFTSAQLNLYNPNAVNTMTLNTNIVSGSDFHMRDALGNNKIQFSANPGTGGFHARIDGNIITEEVWVMDSNEWPDYVFQPGYSLPTLDDYAQMISEQGHLPGVPSAEELAETGIDLGEMQKRQMEKIEELTLYILQLHERIRVLETNARK